MPQNGGFPDSCGRSLLIESSFVNSLVLSGKMARCGRIGFYRVGDDAWTTEERAIAAAEVT